MLGENVNYVPILSLRPSEMVAVENLPRQTRERMTPYFLLAPWVNSKSLSRATERIQRAYPDRDYFLDIDRHYDIDPSNPSGSARREFFKLKDPSDRFLNWTNFIKEHAHVLPCVQMEDQSSEDIRIQVERYRGMGRKCCLRISRKFMPLNMDGVTAAAKNVAARINIHLHRQAFYDEPDLGALDLDEDWVD